MTAMGDNPPWFTDSDVDTFAWEFLRSPYAGPIYADWSLDRRLDTFLRRQGFSRVADDAISPISSWIASWRTGPSCLAAGTTWQTDRRPAPTRSTKRCHPDNRFNPGSARPRFGTNCTTDPCTSYRIVTPISAIGGEGNGTTYLAPGPRTFALLLNSRPFGA